MAGAKFADEGSRKKNSIDAIGSTNSYLIVVVSR